MFVFAKVLQAIGFADVGYGLFVGMTQGDLWKELYMALTGVAFFYTWRLLERWS